MSTTTGPYTLTPGTTTQAVPPGTVQQLAAVILQNRSPYVLAVQAGANSYSLPPYTADLYAIAATGTPVTVVPANPSGASGVLAELSAIWLAPDETPPAAAYPAALPVAPDAIAQQLYATGVPNVLRIDLLAEFTLAPGDTEQITGMDKYASAIITTANYAAPQLIYQWGVEAGGTAYLGPAREIYPPLLPMSGHTNPQLAMPVEGSSLYLSAAGSAATISVYGVNRAPAGDAAGPVTLGSSPSGVQGSTGGSITMAAGTQYDLVSPTVIPSLGALFQGPAFFRMYIIGTNPSGYFCFRDSQTNLYRFADSTQLHTIGGALNGFITAPVPPVTEAITYLSLVAGSFEVGIHGWPNYN